MKILGVDLETTGLNVGSDSIIEVGAVLWDWSRQTPLKMMSSLVKFDGELSPEATAITGILKADLQSYGREEFEVLSELKELAQEADYLVGHNCNQFDRLFFERYWIRHPQFRIHLPWIDTMTDLPFPLDMSTRKLDYLAAEHGFLNPFSHRALFDVLTMLKVAAHYDFDEILKLQKSPIKRVVALVPYDERDKAKAQGFRWDPKERHWFLEGKEKMLSQREYPFAVQWLDH